MLFSGAQGGGGGGGTTLTPWTITEQGNGVQSNIPVEIFVPFSAVLNPDGSAAAYPFPSTSAIRILDADGTTVLDCQEDNRSSDLNSEVRGVMVTAMLPTLTALQARQLTVQKVATTSPATGTDITTAEVVAAAASDCVATVDHNNGTTYTASMNDALAGSAWTNKTTVANDGKWRTGGGLVTEWICSAPFKNGGTSAPNDLRFWLSVSAYKAQRTAVSGPNPIIGVKIKYWVSKSYAQVSSGYSNDWFDLTVAAGSNTQSWVGSTPSKTLTLGANGGNGTITTATVNTGGTTFTANSVGMVIGDGTSAAVICGYVSADQVYVRLMSAMSGTTITSGNWRIYGLGLEYGADLPQQEIWYGGLTISARPIDSTLGEAWNAGAGTGGPFTYLKACNVILPYTTAVADITNSVTQINSCGTNPNGWILSSGGSGLAYAGDIYMYMPGTGGRDDIAPMPGQFVGGLIKNEANGKRKIFENAARRGCIPINWKDQNTGKPMLLNNGTNYVSDKAWSGTLLPTASSYNSSGICEQFTPWAAQIAHHPDLEYLAWLLTGDFYWVDKRQSTIFWAWAANNPNYYGSGISRLACTSSELRGNMWNFRDLGLGIMMIPDRNPAVLGYTRSHLTTYYTNQFTATGSGTPGVSPYPGINIGLINNTGPGDTYATVGFRDMGQGESDASSPWQLGYGSFAFFMLKGAGALTSDSSAFMTWFMVGLTGMSTDSNLKANWVIPAYRLVLKNQAGTYQNDWTNIYKNTACNPTQVGINKRNVTGTGITLSALSGAGITVTMPSGYFNNGGAAFYTDGMIIDLNATSLVGSGAPITPSVTTTSANSALPANGGYLVLTNTGANTIYYSLTVGAGTATTGDTALTAGSTAQIRADTSTGVRMTYLNYITASGSSTLLLQPIGVNSGGTGYAVNDTITLTMSDSGGYMSVVTRAVVTVKSVSGGVITSVQVTTPGVYTATTPGTIGNFAQTASQFSTSGSGTGATFQYLTPHFGAAKITNVATHTLTLDTSGYTTGELSDTVYCYPFAQTGLVSNKIKAPAPAVNDDDGSSSLGLSNSVPVPYTSYVEYSDIARQVAFLAEAQGFADGATANTNTAAAYAGGSQVKWKVS